MKLTSFKRLFIDDYKEAPKDWFPKFVDNLNNFMDPVVTALRNGLLYKDNFKCEIKQLTIVSGTEFEVSYSLAGQPSEMHLTYVDSYVGQTKPMKWAYARPGVLKATAYFDVTTPVLVTVRIMQ